VDKKPQLNGKPILTIEVDLSQVRSIVDGNSSENLVESKSASRSAIKEFVQLFEELTSSENEKDKVFLEQVRSAKSCTKVVWGCGSCDFFGHEGSWTQYYCDGGGTGAEPDFERCEFC